MRGRVPAALTVLAMLATSALSGASAAPRLIEVFTDKARYAPGEPVRLAAQVADAAPGLSVAVRFEHLGRPVGSEIAAAVPDAVPAGTAPWVTLTWKPPGTDFQGYRVEVLLRDAAGGLLDTGATAVDVSSDWSKFPRYGFVSRFEAGRDIAATVRAMNRYHLNGVQFYDWQWQHHRPYSPAAQWPDIANRPIARATVTGLIAEMHRRGMMAMNYNLVSGAYDGYWNDGSGVKTEWGVFTQPGSADVDHQDSHSGLPDSWATRKIYLFNPADPGWRGHLFAEEKKVFDNFAFDGWHIDSLGGRGDLWDAQGSRVDLAATFPGFIGAARSALNRRMLFNTVGLYGHDQVLNGAPVDFLYAELWDDAGTSTYADLNRIVESAQARSDKAIVFAAYMNRGAPDGAFRESSVRLADAVTFASGAAHIELGDGEAMLSSEYFPNQKLTMSPSLKAAMRDDYDFLVAYQNLLRDDTRAAALRVEARGIPTSTDGRAGAVWTLAKQRPGYDIIHFLNLENAPTNRWRDPEADDPAPDVFTNVPVKLYVSGSFPEEGALWAASPDADHGKTHPLATTTGEDAGGRYVAFTLPRLHYWTMVWLRKTPRLGGTLLAEDFEGVADGGLPPGFDPASGTWGVWRPEGGSRELFVRDGGGILTYRPGFNTGDYTVEGSVTLPARDGNAALLARVQPSGGFYQVELKGGTTWALYKHDGASMWREMASGPFAYAAGTVHRLALACTGNRLRVSVDGQDQGTFTDSDAPYWTGTIGLRTERAAARFDNLRVTSPLPDAPSALFAAGGLVAASPAEWERLDVDRDGAVTVSDAVLAWRDAIGLAW